MRTISVFRAAAIAAAERVSVHIEHNLLHFTGPAGTAVVPLICAGAQALGISSAAAETAIAAVARSPLPI